MKSVGIVDYQTNNLSSIYNAIKKLNYKPILINKYVDEKYEILIIPGTGSFSHGMKYIKENGLAKLIYDHIDSKSLIIGICLGFQLLFKRSFEFGQTDGLGVLDGDIVPFQNGCKKPNIGWSKLTLDKNNNSSICINENLNNKEFYHVHSYYAEIKSEDSILTYSYNNNFKFVSSICFDNVLGFQFHPEKSGINGINLLDNILKNYEKI